ncbi:HicB family protein, partial [Streptococcus suis]|nr:HicB family protein [Streptococcus suis]
SDLKNQYPNADVALIGIDMLDYMRKYHSKKVRKNVTIPEYLNDLAEDKNLNFSQVLTEALELKLNA